MKKLIFCFSLLLITPLFSGHLYGQPGDDEKQENVVPQEYDTAPKTSNREALRAQRSALKAKMEAEREAAIKKRVEKSPEGEAVEPDSLPLPEDGGPKAQ